MSKIGQYILEQMERGNYTLDERGKVNVSLSNRKERTDAPKQATSHTIQENGGGRQHQDKTKEEE